MGLPLRYYHRIGLLKPASVDASTGYRHYGIHQIPTAQVIRRFRDLGMPVEEVRTVLSASVEERARMITLHRRRLEEELARTTASLATIEELTAPAPPNLDIAVSHRTMAGIRAVAIRDIVRLADLVPWFRAAAREVDATLVAQSASPAGAAGALVEARFFTEEAGEITVFVPCSAEVRTTGRACSIAIPGAELAVVTHRGDHQNIDRSYGALGAYVAQKELKVEGPVREIYVVGRRETADSAQWITEIGWPIFRTRTA